MPKIFYPTSEHLRYLLESIHNREVALPDFQRDFVWEPGATEELLESLCRNFPAGSLLRIKNGDRLFFAPREIEGAPPLDGRKPSYLILDGQQRLTSLYQALYGVGRNRFFLDISSPLKGADLEDAIFYRRDSKANAEYGSIKAQADALVFPFTVLFRDPDGYEAWLDRVLEQRDGATKQQLKGQLREIRTNYLKPVEEYEFPVVTLEDMSAEAVCTIFETLNRTGIKLSAFDLLTARFWPEEIRLRDWLEEARAQCTGLEAFAVDPYYILQVVALVEAIGAPSCKKSDVLELTPDQVRRGWMPAIRGISDFITIIRDDCGVIIPRWLPYAPMLVSGGAICAKSSKQSGPLVGAFRQKVVQWFWCSVFGQKYENAPNSQASKDLIDVTQWVLFGSVPDTIEHFTFDYETLRQTTPKQRALYQGVISLIIQHGARDFHSAKPISSKFIEEERIDDHHVFPKNYLKRTAATLPTSEVDCILNRTLLDRVTNIRISDRAPKDYLAEMSAALGQGKLNEILTSHLLPRYPHASWETYEGFLRSRADLLTTAISKVVGQNAAMPNNP